MAGAGLTILCVGGGLLGCAVPATSTAATSTVTGEARSAGTVTTFSGPAVTMDWDHSNRGVTAQSSPAAFTSDKRLAVVVGDRSGHLHAYYVSSGATVPGWPVTVPDNRPVDSTPSVAGDLIFVGTGNAASPANGGYLAVRANGTRKWYTQIRKTPSDTTTYSGVLASLALGYLEGTNRSVVAGSLGQEEDELNYNSGAVRDGFPWLSTDTEFSTPAIANLYGNGKNYIIEGAEQTAGTAFGHHYTEGGHLRILSVDGNAGTGTPIGGVVCDYTPDQGVYSSPAVGHILSGGAIGIVAGTSTDVHGASYTDKFFALNTDCKPQWVASLDGNTMSSPALVDALGVPGGLQIAEGTAESGNTGTVYLLNGTNGKAYWTRNLPGEIIGGIGSADLGAGYQDLIVPTTRGAYILNGKTGAIMDQVGGDLIAEQNSPLVTDDPDGHLGITLAGYNAHGGVIAHFTIAGTTGSLYDETGAWPQFHHDPQLTGTTLAPLES